MGFIGIVPLAIGAWSLARAVRNRVENDAGSSIKAVGILGVAGITFANGGDNTATVYTPVFRRISPEDTVVTIVVFLVLVAVWCFLGRLVGTRKKVTEALERIERWLVPVVLMGSGC